MYSEYELFVLLRIAGMDDLFGLERLEDPNRYRIEEGNIGKRLEKLGLVQGNQLTDKGAFIVGLLEYYNRAEDHLFINNLKLAMIGQTAIGLRKLYDQEKKKFFYRISPLARSSLFSLLTRMIPLDGPDHSPGDLEPAGKMDFWERVHKCYPSFLLFKVFHRKTIEDYFALAWNDREAIAYDFFTGTGRRPGPDQIKEKLRVIIGNQEEMHADHNRE